MANAAFSGAPGGGPLQRDVGWSGEAMSALPVFLRISTPVTRRRSTGRVTVVCVAVLAVLAALTTAASPAAAAAPRLMRYPYLTDLTKTSVQVTFDTDVKIASVTGAVRWGTPSGTTGCTLTRSSAASTGVNTVNAPIAVAGTVEYQSSLRIVGLSAGAKHCYRVFTGGSSPVDLLGSDVAPRFKTLSSSGTYTFDVLGDWGDNSIAGGANQKKVDALIARSGAEFAVSTGDIAYDTGTQTNYGNLVATGTAVSEIFGPSYWKAPGASIPLFSTLGNHGRSTTFLQNWKQKATVSASNGKYVMETYSGIDGTTSASYPSVWYAFSVAGARFYVLNADWNDNNKGTAASPYQVDRDYHWRTSSPEYRYLKADLAAHRSALKFAFFHYPLRADSATEASDTFLQNNPDQPTGQGTLEGLLANNGVDLAFNGHAHLYQRNVAPPGGVTSYVTGGGGAKVGPVNKSHCSPTDAYAVGWSYTSAAGSKCGAAKVPTSEAQVYHFLKVAVNGTSVRVTPTNSAGATFDTVTYNFAADSAAPGAPSALTAAASGSKVILAWTRSGSADVSAQDVYRNGRWLATVVPGVSSYTDVAPVGGAVYTVRSHDLAGNQSGESNSAVSGG